MVEPTICNQENLLINQTDVQPTYQISRTALVRYKKAYAINDAGTPKNENELCTTKKSRR